MNLPNHFNGVGLHDTPGASTAAWGYNESIEHARLLRAHGVTLYKILSDGANKAERCRAYVDSGIVPIVRPYIDKPWGRGLPVTPADQLRPYIDNGVQLIELGNEWNIAAEWPDDRVPNAKGIATEVLNWWEVCLRRENEVPGLIALFPSNTPGGNVDHRLCYTRIIEEIVRRGLQSTIKHIAVHPRPHNNPPDTKWSATNTVTFDEWRWIRDQFEGAGINASYWATEHGYSVGDNQNAGYPRIDLGKWFEYNAELFLRLNHAHANAIEPELSGVMYWFEAGWGHYGAWAKDSLRDSIVPEMPAPSPLWGWMEQGYLNFVRYGDPANPPNEDIERAIQLLGGAVNKLVKARSFLA